MEKAYNKLVKGIKQYFKGAKFKRAVFGLSGGLDSSVVAKLLVDALGMKNVYALIMPEKDVTSDENIKDAINLCKKLRIKYYLIEINDFIKDFDKLKWNRSKTAKMNIKARIRANILYDFANSNNCLVIGTSNKSELILGYGTKYGDLACDVIVIGDLYKTDVKKLAYYLDLPTRIISKEPSAELFKGQTDKAELGADYFTIDKILRNPLKTNKKILKRIKENKHKRKKIKIVKV
jgi:NAD+ synthase